MIRVIPSLLTNGNLHFVGQKFGQLRTVGSIQQAIRLNSRRDVDELMILDPMASREGRSISIELVERCAKELRIPLTVGGGIISVSEVATLMYAGADRICLGNGIHQRTGLLSKISKEFGRQAVIVAVNVRRTSIGWEIYKDGTYQSCNLPEFVKELDGNGAGELLLQNTERDGTRNGVDIELIETVRSSTDVSLIASCGLSSPEDAIGAVRSGANAVAAGSLFQFTSVTPDLVKKALSDAGYDVRK